jgi:hypothetical protein
LFGIVEGAGEEGATDAGADIGDGQIFYAGGFDEDGGDEREVVGDIEAQAEGEYQQSGDEAGIIR